MAENSLDLKDKKILSILEVEGRLSYSKIAKRVGLSKQVVKYRMDKLEEKDIIQEYYAIVNDSKFGRKTYVVYLQLIDLDDVLEKKLISSLKKESRIASYFSCVGNWDFALAVLCKNEIELEEILTKCLKPISSKIKNKVITSQVEWNYFSTKIFSDLGKKKVGIKFEEPIKINEGDIKLVDALLNDGRKTFVDLAEEFNMTPNGIKERIRNLEKKEILLGYKTKINYEKLGYIHSHFFIKVNGMDKEFFKKVKNFLKLDGRTEAASRFFGYCDFEFRCNLKSVGEIYQLKRKLKNEFKEKIDSVENLIVVRSGISHLKD